MLGGRAADLLGRRRVFLSGVGLFAFASLLCAVANTKGLLVGGRALQGVGGAVMSPATLAIIATSFAEGAERNRALGIWGAIGGIGGSSGALLGGILTEALGWPAIFVDQHPDRHRGRPVPGRRVIPEGRNVHATRHFDVAGATLVTGGLFAITYGIVRTDVLGWGSPGVLAPLAAGVGADRPLPPGRGPLRGRAARPAVGVPHAPAARREPRGVPDVLGAVRDVVLPDAVPAAGPRLLGDRGRAGVRADDAERRRRLDARAAADRALRRARRRSPAGCCSRPPACCC